MLRMKRTTLGAQIVLALAAAAALPSPTAHAQSCTRPDAAAGQWCNHPDTLEGVEFNCIPAEANIQYTSIFGIGYVGKLDYFLPDGCPPPEGFPVVMMFHGGSGTGSLYRGTNKRSYGPRTIRALVDAGYAVLVPHAPLWNWHTNWPEVLGGTPYEWIRDYRFLDKVIDFIRDPSLPAGVENRKLMSLLDADNLFAAGLSDGGAQASRMARSWLNTQNESIFKAIVLNAGSWSTCSADFGFGVICNPVQVDWKHSPTLFLHGENDSTVSVEHAEIYAEALETTEYDIEWRALIADGDSSGTPLDEFEECSSSSQRSCVSYDSLEAGGGGHRFLEDAPEAHVQWFDHYLEP